MKFLTHYGLWKIDEIKVRIINDNLAWIDYQKYEMNADKYRDVVNVGFFERRKGISLENKISKHLEKLKRKLEQENEKIIKHKELESKFNN